MVTNRTATALHRSIGCRESTKATRILFCACSVCLPLQAQLGHEQAALMGAPPATGGVTVDPKKLAEIETARCAAAPRGASNASDA